MFLFEKLCINLHFSQNSLSNCSDFELLSDYYNWCIETNYIPELSRKFVNSPNVGSNVDFPKS